MDLISDTFIRDSEIPMFSSLAGFCVLLHRLGICKKEIKNIGINEGMLFVERMKRAKKYKS